jgi:hypothetical protein
MRFHFPDLRCFRGADTAAVGHGGQMLPAVAVTVTVVLGPILTVAYRLTRSPDMATDGVSFLQVTRGLLCLLMFVSLFFSARVYLLVHRLVRPLVFLAVCAVLTSFAHPFPYQNIVFAGKLAFVVLIFASAFQSAEEGLLRERWLTACAWVILLTMALNTGVGLALGRHIGVYGSPYATAGLVGEPSVASALVLSTLPVFLESVASSVRAFAGLGVLFALLFFTMCRSALIAGTAAMCSTLVISLSSLKQHISWRRVWMPVCLLLLLAGLGLSSPTAADLMARFRDLNPREGTGSGRYFFWRVSLRHIASRPMRVQLQGEGMGSIKGVIKRETGLYIGAHHDWLDLVHAFGLLGLMGISWWYCELARLARHSSGGRDGPRRGAYAALVILGLNSIGTGGSYEPSWALSYAALGLWAGRAERISSGSECSVCLSGTGDFMERARGDTARSLVRSRYDQTDPVLAPPRAELRGIHA